MSIALCTLQGGGYKHSWRFISGSSDGERIHGIWQCNDCHRVEKGRLPTLREMDPTKGENVIIQSETVP